MEEAIQQIAVPELVSARLTCKGCKTVVESTIDKLENRRKVTIVCPGCGAELRPFKQGTKDAFDDFASALERMKNDSRCDVLLVRKASLEIDLEKVTLTFKGRTIPGRILAELLEKVTQQPTPETK